MNQMDLQYIIENEYEHEHYDVTVQIAKDAAVIHTQDREKQREEIKRYRRSESEELMDQRVRVHNPVTEAVLQPVYSYQSYIYRAPGVKKIHKCTDTNKKKLIDDNFARFYGEMSLLEYLYRRIRHYNNLDSGAFIGFDRNNISSSPGTIEKVQIYPVEFPSDQVVSHERDDNGKLTSLTALRTFVAIDDKGKETSPLNNYLHYYPGGWKKAYESDSNGTTHPEANPDNGYKEVVYMVGKKPVTYWVAEGENDTTEVPFACVGAYEHPEYNGEVYATFAHSALGFLREIIRDGSLLSVQKVVHNTPDRSVYVKPCKHVNEQMGPCNGGYYGGIRNNDHICQACQGHGYSQSNTEQQETVLQWPDNPADLVELSKTKHYHERPLNISEMYISEIKRSFNLVFATTYNQNSNEPVTSSQKTATEVVINADMINNKLSPLAGKIEDLYELAHRIAHQYYNIKDGDVELVFPPDFKILTIDELLAQRKEAIAAQAPPAIIKSIDQDIMNKQYRNFPDIKADIEAFQSWKPWSDKTTEETVIISQTRATDDFQRQLWENWTAVVNQVKFNLTPNEYVPKFYLLSRKMQSTEIKKALDKVSESVRYMEVPEPEPILFDE